VQFVGAKLGNRVDRGAARAAVLRAFIVGHHAEFGYRIRRQLHHLVAETLVRSAVEVIVGAIEQVVGVDAAQPVDVERALARTVVIRLVAGARNHSRREFDELGVIAAVERQRGNLPRRHHLAVLARVGLQLRGFRGGRYRRIRCRHLQLHINALVRAHGQFELRYGRLKSLHRHFQLVGADRDIDEAELSPVVAGRRLLHTRCRVVQNHIAVRNHCPAGVSHGSKNGCGIELRLALAARTARRKQRTKRRMEISPRVNIRLFVARATQWLR